MPSLTISDTTGDAYIDIEGPGDTRIAMEGPLGFINIWDLFTPYMRN